MAPKLFEQVAARTKVTVFMLDAGYAQLKKTTGCPKLKEQAIIPMNFRNEKEPPAGMTPN
jgi:IS5 family transposase